MKIHSIWNYASWQRSGIGGRTKISECFLNYENKKVCVFTYNICNFKSHGIGLIMKLVNLQHTWLWGVSRS
jgi:hypothetical protein